MGRGAPIGSLSVVRIATASVLALAAGGCGSKAADDPGSGKTVEAAEDPRGEGEEAAAPPLEALPLGKDHLSGYAYSRGPGRAAFAKASAAADRRRWEEAARHARAALLADPGHLEGQWLLATALAELGEHDQVAAPLSAAIAGDWMRWGRQSTEEPALDGFFGTEHGARFRSLLDRYEDAYRRTVDGALLVVGRRGAAWAPAEPGEHPINHRAEIYAYDLDGGRYLRVSRTNAALVGFLRAPDRRSLAFVAYDRVWLPSEEQAAAGQQPILRQVSIGTIDLASARMSAREAVLEDVVSVELSWAPPEGERAEPTLVARVRGAGPARAPDATYRIDAERGRAHAVSPEQAAALRGNDALVVTYGEVRRARRAVEDVAADWDDEGTAGAFRLEPTRKTIALPSGELAGASTMRWSPDKTRLAFATVPVDVCSEDPAERASTLYVVDAAPGVLRAAATGTGPWAPAWVDERRLAYVDVAGEKAAVRLVDVASGSEIVRLEGEGGVATDRLITRSACPETDGGEGESEDAVEDAVEGAGDDEAPE